ncbi:MAG: DUF1700 domain-containing protein [Dehalococcoidales bacterium]|nr:DUF1700 domain-containing protein [Dehalococcoidales bacterium]
MSKQEFLAQLRDGLTGLPQSDIEERLAFYEEMIDDRIEEGLSEEQAVSEIGSVEQVIAQIVEETPFTRIVKERVRPKRKLQTWEIILLILGSPVWVALLIAAFAVMFSVYIVIWAVILSLWAVALSLLISAFACIVAIFFVPPSGSGAAVLVMISVSLVLAGLSIIMFFGCKAATKGAVILTKKIALGIKNMFIGKERAR